MKDKELREIVRQLSLDVKRLETRDYEMHRKVEAIQERSDARFKRLLEFLNVEEYKASTTNPDGFGTYIHIYRTKA